LDSVSYLRYLAAYKIANALDDIVADG